MIALQNIEELQKQKQEEEQVYPMITHYAFILSSGRIIIITLDLPCYFMWGNGFRTEIAIAKWLKYWELVLLLFSIAKISISCN